MYKALKEQKKENAPKQAVIYPDPLNPGRSIIRCYPGGTPSSSASQQRVNLYREGTEYLLIDGVRYPMSQRKKGEKTLPASGKSPQSLFDKLPQITPRNYRNELNQLFQQLSTLTSSLCTDNLFVAPADKELIIRYSDEVLKRLRNVEIEEEKLQFNLQQYGGANQKEV